MTLQAKLRSRFVLLLTVAGLSITTASCGQGDGGASVRGETFVRLAQGNSGTITATRLLEEGTFSVRLSSARNHPSGVARIRTSQTICRYQVEVVQTENSAGEAIFDGRTTEGFRYIIRFRWTPAASGGLSGRDLDGSLTLLEGDGDGPVLLHIPETARYQIRARNVGGYSPGDPGVCSFVTEVRRLAS